MAARCFACRVVKPDCELTLRCEVILCLNCLENRAAARNLHQMEVNNRLMGTISTDFYLDEQEYKQAVHSAQGYSLKELLKFHKSRIELWRAILVSTPVPAAMRLLREKIHIHQRIISNLKPARATRRTRN